MSVDDLEVLVKELQESNTGYKVVYHGLSPFPWVFKGGDMVEAVTVFAVQTTVLDIAVGELEEKGWVTWIKGTMNGIPAAYLLLVLNP